MNTLNTQTHSCKEMTEFYFENAQVKSISNCKQREKSKLSLPSECVQTKLCKPNTYFTSHLYSLCGMMRYKTLRVKLPVDKQTSNLYFTEPEQGCRKQLPSCSGQWKLKTVSQVLIQKARDHGEAQLLAAS